MSAARLAVCVAGCALAVAGCGGNSASRAQVRQVTHVLPEARDVRCARHPGGVTRCEAHVRKRPVGVEHWRCEFTLRSGSEAGSYSGTDSCWTEDGSPESVRATAGSRALGKWLRR
jgi:hypothetical protein